MYRASLGWGSDIETIEITRETDKTVWFVNDNGNNVREAKSSDWRNWFDTFKDAKEFLINRKQSDIDDLRRRLEGKKSELGNLKGLKE